MLPLRFAPIWLGLGWILVVSAVVGSLVPGDETADVSFRDKLLHVGTYLVLMLWFAGLSRRSLLLFIATALFLLGMGLEFLQGHLDFVTRKMDPLDILANGVGIALAFLLAVAGLSGWCSSVEGWLGTRR